MGLKGKWCSRTPECEVPCSWEGTWSLLLTRIKNGWSLPKIQKRVTTPCSKAPKAPGTSFSGVSSLDPRLRGFAAHGRLGVRTFALENQEKAHLGVQLPLEPWWSSYDHHLPKECHPNWALVIL